MAHDFLDLTELVRSLQRSEGYQDCFRRGSIDCDQLECAWRPYCLEISVGEEWQDTDPNH